MAAIGTLRMNRLPILPYNLQGVQIFLTNCASYSPHNEPQTNEVFPSPPRRHILSEVRYPDHLQVPGLRAWNIERQTSFLAGQFEVMLKSCH